MKASPEVGVGEKEPVACSHQLVGIEVGAPGH